jgi:DNA-binding response OmpR family regulator
VRLLLVEDEKKVSDLVARALRAESFAVDVADDGAHGWELAQSYEYDLIILDLMLPRLSGEELLRRIRRSNQQVPILVLTARATTEDKVHNFEAGTDDYLKALLRRGPITRSSVLRVGDLEVDRFTKQVRRGGRRIELTAKEYALLEYLAANPGRVFSRTMIIEHVWDQSFEGLTNIVDVYVRHLRSKVDDPFPVKLIRTVRGVGYGLAESAER